MVACYRASPGLSCHEGRKEMFHLTTHSTHFIYGYVASDIWLRTILIVRKETRCSHVGYSFRLTARVLLYAPSHIQKTAFVTPVVEHCLEREIAQWVHPMKDRSDDPSHTMSERSYHGATSRSFMPRLHESGPFQGSHGQPRETTQHLLDPIWATFRPTQFKLHVVDPQFFIIRRTVQIGPKFPSLKCAHISLLA